MRPTGYWRPEGYWEPLIGSYLRSADETRNYYYASAYIPKGTPCTLHVSIYSPMQIEIFLAALTFYESCCKAVAIEGSQHATDIFTYVHTPPIVAVELVSARG